MFKDRLDSSVFTSLDGRNYRNPGLLNINDLRLFVESLGYTIMSITQEFRHITMKIHREKQDYFLKLGTTPDISTRTENEAIWNASLSKYFYEDSIKNIIVPKILLQGKYNELSFYITKFYEPNFIASKFPPDKKSIIVVR